MGQTTVLIVDDHTLVRDGIKRILEAEPDIQVVGVGRNGQEAVDLVKRLRPTVVLMDIQMPVLDGILATRYVKECCPETAVVILTMYDRDVHLFQAVKEGAMGYVLKDAPSSEVLQAIRAVARGDSLLQPSIARRLMQGFATLTNRPSSISLQGDSVALSPRELDVLRLLGQGLSNKAISEALFICERTVKKHVGEILRTLGVSSRTEAVITAFQRGLIHLEAERPTA